MLIVNILVDYFLQQNPETQADIYKKVEWRQDVGDEKRGEHGEHLCWDPVWDPDFMICEKSILPKTRAVNFIHYYPGSPPTWASPVFTYEDEEWNADSYRLLCTGDSGSGQFTTNGMESIEDPSIPCRRCRDIEDRDKNFKHILTAIHTHGRRTGRYKDTYGKQHTLPCGTYFHRKDLRELRHKGMSQSLASPKIHNWIKDKYKNM